MKISVVIPFKKDSNERLVNIQAQIKYLLLNGITDIVVVEQGSNSRDELVTGSINYTNIENDGVFNKCKANNLGASLCKHDVVCFLDTDILIPFHAFITAYEDIVSGYMGVYCLSGAYGLHFDGDMKRKFIECNFDFNKTLTIYELMRHKNDIHFSKQPLTGSFMMHRDFFIRIGGWNEGFEGWGYEDAEFNQRVVIGYGLESYKVLDDVSLIHLEHPKYGNNSWYAKCSDNKNRELYHKIVNMGKGVKDYAEYELSPYLKKTYFHINNLCEPKET